MALGMSICIPAVILSVLRSSSLTLKPKFLWIFAKKSVGLCFQIIFRGVVYFGLTDHHKERYNVGSSMRAKMNANSFFFFKSD